MNDYQIFPEPVKFHRKRKTSSEIKIEELEKEKKSALDFFKQISFMQGANVVEPKGLLKIGYIFNNPNVKSFLEGDNLSNSCDKYAIVYAYHSKYGVSKKILPEASTTNEKPITMIKVIEGLLSRQSDISFVAVLKKTYFKGGDVSSHIFLYHFDIEKYYLEKEREKKLFPRN
jgi:hypothetical protein